MTATSVPSVLSAPPLPPSRRRRWITRRVLPVVIVLGAVLFFFRQPLFFGFEIPPFETGGTIPVIVDDEAGNRVEGAQLTQHGLRSVLDPGTGYGWRTKEHGEQVTVISDEAGRAEIAFPKWVSRAGAALTGAVSVVAEHPDYCTQWNMDCSVPQKGVVARLPHITLKRGGRLRIKAFREVETTPLTDFQALISGLWYPGRWQPEGDAWLSPVIEPGPRVFRIVDRTDPERLQFSKAIAFTSTAGQTTDFDVPLQPGMAVRGRLDPAIPRPVKNGFVVVTIHDEPVAATIVEGVGWQTWTKVSENGDFEFASLPPSSEVRLLAWCDGSVSKMPDVSTLPAVERPRFNPTISRPQFFAVEPTAKYEIAMEPTARCEVTVTTTSGKPVEGVSVSFSPNVIYGRGSTIFGWTGRSELPPKANDQNIGDILRKTESQWDETLNDPNSLRGKFEGVTDANGKVVVIGLPGRGPSYVDIHHEQWTSKGNMTPPFRSDFAVKLQPGQSAKATIVVVPKPAITDKLINPPPPRGPSILSQAVQSLQAMLGL
ncbi:MAG: hypothetical protein AABP62_25470 [Planctomycetota bacterium]